MMGRPSTYTPEVAQQICERIAAGEYVTAICESEFMPHRDTIYRWLSKHKDFADAYARAREMWAECQLEEIIKIARTPTGDTYIDKDGNEKTNHEVLARSRLHVDTLKWALAKVNRKRFGESSQVDMTNSDGSLAVPADPTLIASKIEAIYQKALAARPTTDAVFEEIPDDGSDLC